VAVLANWREREGLFRVELGSLFFPCEGLLSPKETLIKPRWEAIFGQKLPLRINPSTSAYGT